MNTFATWTAIVRALIRAREQRGLSIAALSKALGFSPSAVGKWESGECWPAVPNLLAWCKYLGVELKAGEGA